MSKKIHPLVQKTKVELERLDMLPNRSWEEQKKYRSEFLPISVEPKLRPRALKFMNALIKLLEENGHSIKFEYNECHIEMYGQLTEINLRQKHFRKRIKGSSGNSINTYEKSDKLEFQVGSYARKGWIDKLTKNLEDYIPSIYDYIEKDSIRWAEWSKQQKIKEKEREKQEAIEAEKQRLKALEEEKLINLITEAKNYKIALEMRIYIKALEQNISKNVSLSNRSNKDYIKWAYQKADEIDPLMECSKS